MTIQCAIFDIDGTLINRGQQFINPPVVEAIHTLQDQGIEVIIATGRAYYFIMSNVKRSLNANFTITINGGCIYNQHQKIIKQVFMDDHDTQTLIQNCRKDNNAIGLKCEQGVEIYHGFETFQNEYLHGFTEANILIDKTKETFSPSSSNKGMGCFILGNVQLVLAYHILMNETTIVKAHETGCDVFPNQSGKEKAIDSVLESLNLTWDNVISFGDSSNDIKMLEHAAIGVAMGNGSSDAKAAADYITDSVLDDGIVSALKHFNLIP